MRSRLTFLALAIAPHLLAIEIPIQIKPEIVSNSGYFKGIASDGRTFLILNGFITGPHYDDLAFTATLIGLDGSMRTPRGFRLGDFIGQAAAVASSGNGYLVVINNRGKAGGVRISGSGQVLDASPFSIGPASPGGLLATPISLAWDGERYVVLWQNYEPALHYAYVTEDGHVENVGTISLSTSGVVTAGKNGVSVLTLRTNAGVLVQSLSRNGFGNPVLLTSSAASVAVASNTDRFLAIWTDRGLTFAQQLDGTGHPMGLPFSLPIVLVQPERITAAWDGTSYVVLWLTGTSVRALHVTSDGVASDIFDVATDSTEKDALGIVCAAGRSEIVIGGPSVMALKTIDVSNRVSPPASETGTYAFPAILSQSSLHAAFNGVDYVVSWQGRPKIRYARISQKGQRLDGDGFPVADGSLLDAVTGSGITLLVWNENAFGTSAAIRAARIDPSGKILDIPPLQLDRADAYRARALWDGSQFVVFWAAITPSTMPPRGTLATRISLDGTIIDSPPRQVFPLPENFEVAKSKDRYQLAYPTGTGLNVVTVSSELKLATASHALSLPTETVKSFSITSNGNDFFVAWNNDAEEIVGQNANWDAQAIGPRLVYSNDAIKKGRPQVTFDGTEYIVTWPEATDSSFVFKTRRIDRDAAEDVGPVLTLARGPLINSVRPPLLNDWSYVSAPVPAVVYGRTDEVGGLLWFERLFLQEAFSDRHRVVTH